MSEKERSPGSCILPLSRIRTIMKSSPEVSTIGQDALFLIAKATEVFVSDLAKHTLKHSKAKGNVSYRDLAEIVNEKENWAFLQDIIPKKILYKDFLEMNKNKTADDESSDDCIVLD